jgi:hypothetical membrane protein
MRHLALGGLAGPVWFAAVATLCASLRPDYSHAHQFLSELGATNTPNASLMNYAGFLPLGLMIAGFGVSIRAGVPRHASTTVGAFLVILFGLGIAASGLISCDVGCPQTGGSLENILHEMIGPASFVSGSLAAIVLGIGFRGIPLLRSLSVYSIASGVLALCFLAALAGTLETRVLTGTWQRLLLTVLFTWCAIVGLRLFREHGAE